MRGRPTDCIWAHPQAGRELVIHFPRVSPAARLTGRYGLSDSAAAVPDGAPVSFVVRAGSAEHPFTAENRPGFHAYQVTRPPREEDDSLTFTITAERDGRRHFCFTAELERVGARTRATDHEPVHRPTGHLARFSAHAVTAVRARSRATTESAAGSGQAASCRDTNDRWNRARDGCRAMTGWIKPLLARHWWLGMTVAGWGALMFSSGTERGFDQFGVWSLERAEAARDWLAAVAAGAGLLDLEPARAHLVSEPYQGPLNGLFPAVVWRTVGQQMDVLSVSRLSNSLMVCLTAWCLFSIGRRAGGLLAGLGAAVALISVPRIWGAATSPGYTAAAMFTMTLAAMCMAHARDRISYVVPALLSLVAALLTTQLAWLLILPWIHLTFFDRKRSPSPGLLTPRRLTVWAPLIFPLAVVLIVLVFPPFAEAGAKEVVAYLKGFLELPREPTLYLGEVYEASRLPWHAAFLLTALTTPPTVLFLAAFGITVASPLTAWVWRRDRDSGSDDTDESVEAVRLSWSLLVLTMGLPLLLGTTRSHGVDLLALALPWCAVFAGVGLKRATEVIATRLQVVFRGQPWARFGTLAVLTTLSWGVFVFAFKDTEDVYPAVESYYNWMVSGVDGAAELGLPRNPHGPTPPSFIGELVGSEARARVAIVPETGSGSAILQRYVAHGLVPDGLTPGSAQTADLVIFRFDEVATDFYELLPDLFRTIRGLDESSVRWLRRENLPLFAGVRVAD